jgi:hypothetical protein
MYLSLLALAQVMGPMQPKLLGYMAMLKVAESVRIKWKQKPGILGEK